MLDCCTFFFALINKGIVFVDGFCSIFLHLTGIHSVPFLGFLECSSENSLSLLQNSPLVSILILKSLVSMGTLCLMAFFRRLVTSHVRSG